MRSHRVHPRGRSLIGRRVVLLQDVEAQVRMPTDVDVALDVLVDSSRTAEDCCNIVEMPIPRASTRSCTSTLSMLSPSFSNITVVVHPFQPYRAAARCWCMSGIGVARLFGQHRAREWLGGYQCLLVGAAAICILVCQLSTMVLDEDCAPTTRWRFCERVTLPTCSSTERLRFRPTSNCSDMSSSWT